MTAAIRLLTAILALTPTTRDTIAALVRAIRDDRPKDARDALELALRLQFVARQNKQ